MEPRYEQTLHSLGLLILRVGAGALLFLGHGLSKLGRYGQLESRFSDPLGIGSGTSLALVVFAEVVCSLLVVFGLATRLAAIPIIIFMMVAFFIHHAADPWSKRELAAIYGVPFLTLLFTGAGRFSLDALLARIFHGPRRRR